MHSLMISSQSELDGFPLATLGRLTAFRVVTDFPVTSKETAQAVFARRCRPADFSGRRQQQNPSRLTRISLRAGCCAVQSEWCRRSQ